MVQQFESTWYERASLLLRHHRPAEAARLALQRLQSEPHDTQAHLLLTYALLRQERFVEALESSRTTLQVAPWEPEAFRLMAEIYLQLDCYQEAEDATISAIRLRSDQGCYHVLQTKIYYYKGLLYGALEASARALQLDPLDANAMLWRAMTFVRLQRPDEVDHLFEQLLRLAPNSAVVRANLGYVFLLRRAAKPALYHLREALRLDPTLRQTQRHLHQAQVMQHWSHRVMDWHSAQQRQMSQLARHKLGRWLLCPAYVVLFYSVLLVPLLLIQGVAGLYQELANWRWQQNHPAEPAIQTNSTLNIHLALPITGWTLAGLLWSGAIMATAVFLPLRPVVVWLFVSGGLLFPTREAWLSLHRGERRFPLGCVLLLSPGGCALMKSYAFLGKENAAADAQAFLLLFGLFLVVYQLIRVGPLPSRSQLQ